MESYTRTRTQKITTVRRNNTFKEQNHGLSRSEAIIAQAPIEVVINEYNLIQQKKSKLSRHLREVVELKIQFYIQEGQIEVNQKTDLLNIASK